MVAKTVKCGRNTISPGAVATAQSLNVVGKTQGPCDYITVDLTDFLTATAVLTSGLITQLDRIEITIDTVDDPGANTGSGSIAYTLYGVGNMNLQGVPANVTTNGIISTLNRMLFQMEINMSGTPLGTVAVYEYGLTFRIPIGKNAPCTISMTIFLLGTAVSCAAAWTYLGAITVELYSHLVDSVSDIKVKQNRYTGMGPSSEGPIFDIADTPSYWFDGWMCDIQPTAATSFVDRLGGARDAVGITGDGWARVFNADGIIFDQATGRVIKTDMLEGCSPYYRWSTLDLFSNNLYNTGQYFRLMDAPIEAKSLKLQFFAGSDGLATDIYRVWYFFSKQGSAVKQTNAQQQNQVTIGAGGMKQSQVMNA